VIPAIIRKCIEARAEGRDEVVLWGTGSASREFLYVDDAAEGVVLALGCYEGGEPLNLGSDKEISIRALATLIAQVAGYEGRLRWDESKPDGQPRRAIDATRAEAIGWRSDSSFRQGLAETVAWYAAQADTLSAS
jgi:GDP-L-fucose synthase